jgi:hypothetical protein
MYEVRFTYMCCVCVCVCVCVFGFIGKMVIEMSDCDVECDGNSVEATEDASVCGSFRRPCIHTKPKTKKTKNKNNKQYVP